MSDYEVIIAGGGHNALACAAVLCQAGIRTLVAERNEWVGGGAVTRELTLPGFRHNVCSVVHTHIPLSPVYRDLELDRHGVKYVYPAHLRGTIFPDQRCLVMYRDTERMATELARFSARDAQTFRQLVADYGEFIESTYLPLMYWYGFEPLVPRNVRKSIELIPKIQIPLVRQYVARRVVAVREGDAGGSAGASPSQRVAGPSSSA